MFELSNFEPVEAQYCGAFLAVGNFDGVHLGHAALISRLRALADECRAPAIALTFHPRPAEILRPAAIGPPLTTITRKVELLRAAGATAVGVFRTGPWLLGLSAREFFDTVILRQFAAKGMVEGPTFGFGRDRGGDAAVLQSWCNDSRLAFEVVPPRFVDGQLISSSRIRSELAEGRVADARCGLGRPYAIEGTVVHGARRGASLGFPTANLARISTLVPAAGVYAGFARVQGDDRTHPAAIHIGPNATFGETDSHVEAHLLDLDSELYGSSITLHLIERVRGTERFASADDLRRQIVRDVDQVRLITANWQGSANSLQS